MSSSISNSENNSAYDPIEQFRWFNNQENTQGHLTGLRQEVPFERWFHHYAVVQNISDAEIFEKVKARAWAAVSLGESFFRSIIELAGYAFSKIFCQENADVQQDVLHAQFNSIYYSFNAILSPEDAIKMAVSSDPSDENRLPRIGSLFGDWRWGTAYYGERV